MFFMIVVSLLVAGLICLWVALSNLSRPGSRKHIVIKPVPGPDASPSRLPRVGRPVETARY